MSTPVRQIRHLHLGLLIDGQLASECVLAPQRCAILGTSPDATFELPGPRRVLFRAQDGRWELLLTDDLVGKVVTDGAPQPLSALRASQTARPRGSAVGVPLGGGERGRLQLDAHHTLLFRFVDPAPVALPADYRPQVLDADDPVFFGFLGVTAAAAAAFLVVVANVVVDTGFAEEDLIQLTERVAVSIRPPQEEVVEEVVEEAEEHEVETPTLRPEIRRPPKEPTEPEPQVASLPDKPATADSVRASSRLLRDPSAFANILGRMGSTSDDELENALQNIQAERVASADTNALRVGSHQEGDVVVDYAERIGGGTVSPGATDGPTTQFTGRITLPDPVKPDIGDRTLISDVVQSNFPSFTYCFEKELKLQPDLGGRMELEFIVSDGAVEEVAVVMDGVGSRSFSECLEQRAFRWNFRGMPEAEFVYPFVFRAR